LVMPLSISENSGGSLVKTKKSRTAQWRSI
jgi:hypothetical protein